MDTIIEAFSKEITVWTADDLDGKEENFGLKGSPTKLRKVFTPKLLKGKAEIFEGKAEIFEGGPEEAAHKLMEKIREKYII
jgi:electron transfer flavoprotein beta subunit